MKVGEVQIKFTLTIIQKPRKERKKKVNKRILD